MFDLLNLQTLIAAATAGSFAGAAKRLGISPAMVGRRIQALEQEYGVKLIERTTRTQRLTEVGSRFLVKANKIIDELEELNEISRPDAEAMSGRLRLSAPTTLGIKRLAPVMAELAERHPALSVELNLSDRNVDLVAEGYDLAIRIGELKPSSLIARRVGSYHFVCCASPTYLDRFAVPERPEDLRLGRCILNLNLVPRDEWPFVTKGGESFTVGVCGNIEIDNGEALRTAALAGAGIIYVPVDLVAEDITDGRLVEVLAGWRKLVLPIHAIHPSRRFVPGRIGAIIHAIARGLRD